MRKLVPLVLVSSLLVPGTASADGARFRDPDEQPFCEGGDPCPDNDYIDFRRLTHGHGDAVGTVRHGIRTRERWKTKDMGGRHGVTIYFGFDVGGGPGTDREVRVRRKHGELRARMFRGKHLRQRVEGRVAVWRPDGHGLKVRFPARLLGRRLDRYRWKAGWYQREVFCPGSCHSDFGPNRAWYTHRL